MWKELRPPLSVIFDYVRVRVPGALYLTTRASGGLCKGWEIRNGETGWGVCVFFLVRDLAGGLTYLR